MKNKFIKWINGFRKINYEVPLETELNSRKIDLNVMGSVFESMANSISLSICDKVIFGIEEFIAKKVHTNLKLFHYLSKNLKPISHIKSSVVTVSKTYDKELCCIFTIYSLGLDNNIWEFKIKANCMYKYMETNKKDDNMLFVLVEYVNGIIKSMNLSAMCKHEVYIDNKEYFNSVDTQEFKGYVKSFCNLEDYQKYGLSQNFTDLENDCEIILQNIEPMYEDVIKESTIISDTFIKPEQEIQPLSDEELNRIFHQPLNQSIKISDIFEEPKFIHVSVPF